MKSPINNNLKPNFDEDENDDVLKDEESMGFYPSLKWKKISKQNQNVKRRR